MRGTRLLLLSLVTLAAFDVAGCARRQSAGYYMVDPATGQMTPVAAQPQTYAQQPQYAQQQQHAYPPRSYPQQTYTPQQTYAQQGGPDPYGQRTYMQPAPQPQMQMQEAPPARDDASRGLFSSRRGYSYAPAPQLQPPAVVQYGGGGYAAAPAQAAPYGAAQYGYASASPYTPSYSLDAGDKLRIVVFGQDGISNSYLVDASGNVNLPLIGAVPARGTSPAQLAQLITTRLKQGYVREPHVSVEVEAYRPFFILGEVTTPGQYAYVPNMTAEKAVAIAGGFSPRANKSKVELTRNAPGQQVHGEVPLNYPLRPGDTLVVKERWF